jgi:hypothetical protein
MNAPQPVPPRRRLQELRAIPDGQRSEAEWDELHELEISLAPGNRADGAPPRGDFSPPRGDGPPRGEGGQRRPRTNPSPSQAPANARPKEGEEIVKKTFRKRSRKPAKPAGPETV